MRLRAEHGVRLNELGLGVYTGRVAPLKRTAHVADDGAATRVLLRRSQCIW